MSRFNIPDCYEADRQFDRMDLAYTARIMRRPCCECCGEHLIGESYLDLSLCGLDGVLCEKCVKNNMCDISELDDRYE